MKLLGVFLMLSLAAFQQPKTKVISNVEMVQLLSNPEVQLVDIRTPKEWNRGYIKGAKKINFYDADFMSQMSDLDKSKPLIVYCAVGGRSATATRKLLAAGFQEVYDLGGGFNGWKTEQRPITRD